MKRRSTLEAQLVALGAVLRQTRMARGLEQQEVAWRAGISASMLCHIESGRRMASPSRLDSLCEVLKIKVTLRVHI